MTEAFLLFFKHILDIPFAVQIVCAAVSTVLLLGVTQKTKIWRIFVDVSWLFSVMFVLNMLFTVLGYYTPVRLSADIAYLIGIAIYALVASRHKPIVRLAMSSVVFSLNTCMASFGTLYGNMLEMHIDGFDIAITKIVAYIAVVAGGIALFKYPLYKFETNNFDCILNITCNILSAILVIVFGYVRLASSEMNMLGRKFSGYMSLVVAVLFIINIATYFIMYCLCRERERVLEYSVNTQKSQSLRELLTLNEQKLIELREVRHDVNNQYAYMKLLLEQNKYEELKCYFNEVTGTLAAPLFKSVNSGNAIIDSVLNLELAKADEAGVKINMRVEVPHELPFKKSVILGIFTNAIDNAVEAVLQDKTDDGVVDVVVSMQGDYMLFCVTNPTKLADMNNAAELCTNKKNKNVHGYGMKIIQKYVRKCNGIFRCYVKDGQFVSESLLDTRIKAGGGLINEREINKRRRMRRRTQNVGYYHGVGQGVFSHARRTCGSRRV